jgi:hypothetical protein
MARLSTIEHVAKKYPMGIDCQSGYCNKLYEKAIGRVRATQPMMKRLPLDDFDFLPFNPTRT